MSQGLMKKGLFSGALAAAALAAAPTQSDAILIYDLRAVTGTGGVASTDGSQVVLTGAPGTVSLELWAQVSGTDTDHVNDALQQNYVVLQSSETSGDLFTGALGSGFRTAPFNQTGRNGSAANLTDDGVGDWGSNSTSINNTGYMQARSSQPTQGGGTVGQEVDANTWEFKVANWVLTIDAVNALIGGTTEIAIVRPLATASGSTAYAVYHDDAELGDFDGDPNTPDTFAPGSQSSVQSTNTGPGQLHENTFGSSVTFVIPEPTSLTMVGLVGAGLLSRRRRA